MISDRIQHRIDRFKAGMSLSEIAELEDVTFHTVCDSLRRHGAIPDTYLIDEFLAALKRAGLPAPVTEYPFAKVVPIELYGQFLTPKTKRPRAWRTDCAFPFHQLAIEVDGGKFLHQGGRHGSDREKRNAYTICGWRILYFDTDMLEEPDACAEIVRLALRGRE